MSISVDAFHLQMQHLHRQWHAAVNNDNEEAAQQIEKRIEIFEKILKRREQELL